MAEETVILNFEVDQGAAERQLEKIEGILLDNKKAVQDLQTAYKKGNVTQGEYVKENIRLQQNIKKEQDLKRTLIKTIETESNSRNSLKNRISTLVKEYDNLNLAEATGIKRADALEKELAQLNAQLNKGDKAAGLFKNQIGNYPKVLGDAASQIRVAGVSVADIGTKIAALANPVTAAIGIIGALGSAYAHSTRGAKDLESAQNQLSTALKLSSNAFAEFIGATKGSDAGLVSTFTSEFIRRIAGDQIAISAQVSAALKEQLQDLGRLENEVRTNANQLVAENQDLLEKIADDQVNINDKIQAAAVIEQNLIINKRNILSVLKDQLVNLEKQLKLDEDDEAVLDLVSAKRREISAEAATLEKGITRINKQQDDLNAKLLEENRLRKENAAAAQKLFEFEVREANIPSTKKPEDILSPFGDGEGESLSFSQGIDDPAIQASQARQEQFISELKTVELSEEAKRLNYQKTQQVRQEIDQAQITAAGIVFNALSNIAEEGSAEQRALTLVSLALDTAKALGGAIASSQTVGYPQNLVAMATSIAAVLSNIAAAYDAIKGFEEGGYTGPGRDNQIAGAVHANEYVAPAYVVRSPAAQPHLHALERMRGYQDGGFVANQSTAPVNQSLIIANALKNLPPTIAYWKEGVAIGKKMEFREGQAIL